MSDFKASVKKFILDYLKKKDSTGKFDPQTAQDNYDVIKEGLLSSLDYIELISALEEEFDLEIDIGDEDPEEFVKISGLIRLVEISKK